MEDGRDVEEFFVPLAHSEGGLSASMQRGMVAAREGTAVRTHVVHDRMTRDSCFLFRTTERMFDMWRDTYAWTLRKVIRFRFVTLIVALGTLVAAT